VAALRRGGHSVDLLAPARSAQALLGPGEISRLTDLDGPLVAEFLAGQARAPGLAAALRVDAALAVTRSGDLVDRLRAVIPRVLTADPTPSPGVHASRWFAEPLRRLDIDPGPAPTPLVFTQEEDEAAGEIAASLPRGFLALHPGSGSLRKNWPAGRFAELVGLRGRGAPWLLVRGSADDDAARPLGDLPGAVLARNLPVRLLGALLSRAGLYIGNDSGVTHLAAAAGAPTVALFGPTDPATWSPVGPRVEVVESEDGTMEGVGVAAVLDSIGRLKAGHA
jgi:heptosyltransferase-3